LYSYPCTINTCIVVFDRQCFTGLVMLGRRLTIEQFPDTIMPATLSNSIQQGSRNIFALGAPPTLAQPTVFSTWSLYYVTFIFTAYTFFPDLSIQPRSAMTSASKTPTRTYIADVIISGRPLVTRELEKGKPFALLVAVVGDEMNIRRYQNVHIYFFIYCLCLCSFFVAPADRDTSAG
jgi:hypothetical protein